MAYFTTDKDGFMQREDYNVTAAYDVPLKQTIAQIPPLMASQTGESNLGIVCKGDNFKVRWMHMALIPSKLTLLSN